MAIEKLVPSKIKFVRTQPADMPAAEVVVAAEAAGITIDEAGVEKIRSGFGKTPKTKPPETKAVAKKPIAKKGVAKKSSAKKPAAKKVAVTKVTAWTGSKGDFVRAHPTLTPSELVAKAKDAGLSVSKNLVYVTRNKAKGGRARSPKREPGRPPAVREASTAIVPVGKAVVVQTARTAPKAEHFIAPKVASQEAQFQVLLAELGLNRAAELFERERDRVAALLQP